MSSAPPSRDHQVRTIAIDGQKYFVSLRIVHDGVEHIGRLMFTEAATEIAYQDHGSVPGSSVEDAVAKAKEFTDAELVQLNRVAIGLENGITDPDTGKLELDKAQAELLVIVRSLRLHAGVEDDIDEGPQLGGPTAAV
jgi:hypothetical protein